MSPSCRLCGHHLWTTAIPYYAAFIGRSKVFLLRCLTKILSLHSLPPLTPFLGALSVCTLNLLPSPLTQEGLALRIQGSAKRRSPGLVNFVTALAYYICLALPAAYTQPADRLLAEPCRKSGENFNNACSSSLSSSLHPP